MPRGNTKFNETMVDAISALIQDGDTDEQIAGKLGISLRTLYYWKGRHPGLLQAMEAGKAVADDLAEATLYRMAIGYSHPEVKVIYDQERGEFKSHTYMKTLPPNMAALSMWLRCRRPATWRNPIEEVDESAENKTLDADFRIEIMGDKKMTARELQEQMLSYYDRKPPQLKVVGPPDEKK